MNFPAPSSVCATLTAGGASEHREASRRRQSGRCWCRQLGPTRTGTINILPETPEVILCKAPQEETVSHGMIPEKVWLVGASKNERMTRE